MHSNLVAHGAHSNKIFAEYERVRDENLATLEGGLTLPRWHAMAHFMRRVDRPRSRTAFFAISVELRKAAAEAGADVEPFMELFGHRPSKRWPGDWEHIDSFDPAKHLAPPDSSKCWQNARLLLTKRYPGWKRINKRIWDQYRSNCDAEYGREPEVPL